MNIQTDEAKPFAALPPFHRALRIVGGPKAMAKLLGVSRTQVFRIKDGDATLRAEDAMKIELATVKIVRCEHLLPDLPWETLRGPVIDRRSSGDMSFSRNPG